MIQAFLPSDAAPAGGVGVQAHQLANELVRRGNEVCMISRDPAPRGASYEHRRLATPAVIARPKALRAAEAHYFPFRVAATSLTGFDVVHAHGDNAYLFARRRPPLVRTFHGSAIDEAYHAVVGSKRPGPKQIYFAGMQLSFYPLEWLGALSADVTVGISEATRGKLPFIEHIVGEAVNVERFARPPDAERSPFPVVLFVGTLEGRKRGTLLVDAFKRHVLPRMPDAQLWMICEKQGDDGAVKYLGRRPNAELPPLYHRAWVFSLPSSYEGFGIPYVEALAAELPVVATPNAGVVEILGHGRYGLLPSDVELGDALARLLQDAGERSRLAAAGVARARDFSLSNIVDRYEELYAVARSRRRERRAVV